MATLTIFTMLFAAALGAVKLLRSPPQFPTDRRIEQPRRRHLSPPRLSIRVWGTASGLSDLHPRRRHDVPRSTERVHGLTGDVARRLVHDEPVETSGGPVKSLSIGWYLIRRIGEG